MPEATDVFVKCDDLDNIPDLMRQNYIFETDFLAENLTQNSRVLQVGCVDGERIRRLLAIRPDLKITGLEIEKSLVELAREKSKQFHQASFIHADITQPPNLPKYDYVICMNNTLGYIDDDFKAISEMQKLGKKVIISVYSEKFTDDLAIDYFNQLGLEVEKIKNNLVTTRDFGSIKRYSKNTIAGWNGQITDSPVGYICILAN